MYSLIQTFILETFIWDFTCVRSYAIAQRYQDYLDTTSVLEELWVYKMISYFIGFHLKGLLQNVKVYMQRTQHISILLSPDDDRYFILANFLHLLLPSSSCPILLCQRGKCDRRERVWASSNKLRVGICDPEQVNLLWDPIFTSMMWWQRYLLQDLQSYSEDWIRWCI